MLFTPAGAAGCLAVLPLKRRSGTGGTAGTENAPAGEGRLAPHGAIIASIIASASVRKAIWSEQRRLVA